MKKYGREPAYQPRRYAPRNRGKGLWTAVFLVLVAGLAALLSVWAGQDRGGPAVEEVQRRLAALGYYSGPVDGILGSRTTQALMEFEQQNNLAADGQIEGTVLALLGLEYPEEGNRQPGPRVWALARQVGAAGADTWEEKMALAAVLWKNGGQAVEGPLEMPPDMPAREDLWAAQAALLGYDPTGGANRAWKEEPEGRVFTRIGEWYFGE